MPRIHVPTINDSQWDYFRLFNYWHQISQSGGHVTFDFTRCMFLRPNAVTLLGGVARLAERQGTLVEFDWKTANQAVLMNLCQNGFAHAFGHGSAPWSGNSIPYREDLVSAPNPIADYLTDQWIGRGWINVSERVRDAIVGTVWEIYANSFEHAQSPVGVFSCGQYYAKTNELILSVVDFGTGIPSKVRGYLQPDPRTRQIPSSALLNWAFERGNSTSNSGVPRGLGLDFLKKFVRVNNGVLEVYSENSYARIDKSSDNYFDLPTDLAGTAVQIKLICDNRYYRFANEGNS
ncbi:TPA: HAMP domain-containing histidine kinase [Burkholderia vietnamiensis]|nr:HAMP domain-containing histidine kinase [Burkholderia vietnamiensis]